MHRPLLRLAVGAAVAVTAALGGASPALASHLQGGYITAEVTATGHVKGTLTYADIYGCTLGQASSQNMTITAPTSQTKSVSVPLTATRCITGSATYKGSFDVPLDTSSFAGGAPDGVYTLKYYNGNRIGGIVNLANSSTGYVQFETKVRKLAMKATAAPNLGSNVANGIGIGALYSQNLNAADADGGTLSYQTLLKPADPNAPDTDIVSVSQTGQVTIPASTTSTFTGGQHYVYKVRATDSQGDYAERDVLLKVASSNSPPAISGLQPTYKVEPGGTLSIPFSATDPDSGDAVSVSAAGLPAWATLNTTPGNPASSTLVLNPPAGTAGTFGINLDAEDDSNDVVLTGSAFLQIEVGAPPVPAAAPTITRAPATVARTATFEFTGGTSYECRIDGGAWAPCASPFTPTGLADGAHTFEVRADGSEPARATFTLDTTAPAAPAVVGGPSGLTSSTKASFEFTGEPGATFECRLDGGAWAPCASPKAFTKLAQGAHAFEVRQTDAAGNVSSVRTERFSVVGAAKIDVDERAGRNAKVTPILSSTVSASSNTAKLGCRIPGAKITSCTIKAYVTVNGKKVLIGTGKATADGTGERLSVKVKLNAKGRALVDRVGGVKAKFELAANAGKVKVKTSTVARMLPSRTLVVPGEGLFEFGSGTLTAKGKRYVRSLKGQLDNVKAMTCIGHTDAVGSPESNEALGLERAKATCAALKALGVKARTNVKSAGETRPRASNATGAGRALNRRVEIDLDYR